MGSRFELVVFAHPPERVFKDSRFTISVALQALGPEPVVWPSHVRAQIALENAQGKRIQHIVNGPLAGHCILAQEVFDNVVLSARHEFHIANVRVREVSRNHGHTSFRVRVMLADHPTVGAAVTQLFQVVSERIRAPSYPSQLEQQRTKRKQQLSVATTPASTPTSGRTSATATPACTSPSTAAGGDATTMPGPLPMEAPSAAAAAPGPSPSSSSPRAAPPVPPPA